MKENWKTPRTPWGDPDLQGMYTTDALGQNVPFERDPKLGTKAWLTQEEADKRRAERRLAIAFGAPGDTGNYGTEWRDTERARPSTQSSLLIDPPDGRLPPLTPEGQKRLAARPDPNQRPNGPEDFQDPWDRCITRGMPGVMIPNGYANGLQIIQVPGSVILFYEMIHEVRRIPLDGRPHVDKKIRQWWGDARGRWEGDTLVVETTNFNTKTLRSTDPARTCGWWSDSFVRDPTRSITDSPWRIRQSGPGRLPRSFPCRRIEVRIRTSSGSMRAMKAITPWPIC